MRVLVVTGDTYFKTGHPRFELQVRAVERLETLYWGPASLWMWPKDDSFDVVSTQDPFWRGLLGLILARRYKAKLNVQVHADLQAQNLIKRMIADFVLARADSIRVVSERVKEQIQTHGGHRMSTITVLPVFVDIERFKIARRKIDDVPTVLWVGRFEKEKDPLLAIEIFKKVIQSVPDVKMIMLGAGTLEKKIRQAARGLPVEFPGWQSDIVPFYERAHVVLSTSPAESFGASIVEALAAGVPVVARDVGIAREAGALVTSKDALAPAIVSVLNTKPDGLLRLHLLSESEWVKMWKDSL